MDDINARAAAGQKDPDDEARIEEIVDERVQLKEDMKKLRAEKLEIETEKTNFKNDVYNLF